MDAPVSEHAHGIEVRDDRHLVQARVGGNRVCEGACCGFSDAKTSSEQSVSIKKLWVAIVLCIAFMCVEVVGGIKANSLAILTDAAHLISDVAAFAISLFSIWASGWEANPRHSFGFFRIEILGTLVSIQMIWLLAGILVYEAIARLVHGTGEVQGFLMFSVSAFGFVVNIIMAFVLGQEHSHGHTHSDHGHEDDHLSCHGVTINLHHHHHQENIIEDEHHCHKNKSEQQHFECEPLLREVKSSSVNEHKSSDPKQQNINIQGAYLHVLGDSIQSIGVMVGGAIIWCKPEWKYVDLICTLVFSVIVLGTTVKMLRNVLEVLMESTPKEVDATRLEKGLREMDEVVAVHELHIWAITVGKVLLACHVKITPEADPDSMLNKVIAYITSEYKISHVTIQIERDYA